MWTYQNNVMVLVEDGEQQMKQEDWPGELQ